MENKLVLPVGISADGAIVKEITLANTSGTAEEVYTSKPSASKLYTWLGEVISVSVQEIAGIPVYHTFMKTFNTTRMIPPVVKKLPLNDVGTLILQIQRECWQDIIPNQRVMCQKCGTDFTADIDLKKIEIEVEGKEYPFIDIKLSKTYTINHPEDIYDQFKGESFNCIRFRVPTLGDAIRHEKLNIEEITFWRTMAFECAEDFLMVETEFNEDLGREVEIRREVSVAPGYVNQRGTLIFKNDLSTMDLRRVRTGLTGELPSAKMYYEDTCACGKYQVPFYTAVDNFFSS